MYSEGVKVEARLYTILALPENGYTWSRDRGRTRRSGTRGSGLRRRGTRSGSVASSSGSLVLDGAIAAVATLVAIGAHGFEHAGIIHEGNQVLLAEAEPHEVAGELGESSAAHDSERIGRCMEDGFVQIAAVVSQNEENSSYEFEATNLEHGEDGNEAGASGDLESYARHEDVALNARPFAEDAKGGSLGCAGSSPPLSKSKTAASDSGHAHVLSNRVLVSSRAFLKINRLVMVSHSGLIKNKPGMRKGDLERVPKRLADVVVFRDSTSSVEAIMVNGGPNGLREKNPARIVVDFRGRGSDGDSIEKIREVANQSASSKDCVGGCGRRSLAAAPIVNKRINADFWKNVRFGIVRGFFGVARTCQRWD
ncbi:hypothetical protein C8R47DRAFT_1066549 [Mycena vitilis]|nr:hypothetical protein C8R47DRAFT_1066549 [Mycena vitilis]